MKFDGFDANLSIHGAQSVRGSSGSGNLRGLLLGGGALFRSVFGGVAAAVVDAVLDGGRLEGVLAGRGGAAGASFAAPGLQPLSDGDSGDHQDGDGVGPGPTECGVEKQAGQKARRTGGTDRGKSGPRYKLQAFGLVGVGGSGQGRPKLVG